MRQRPGSSTQFPARRSLRCTVERLEDRTLLTTTFTVNNTGDSGPGSLRQAILDADANPPDTGTDLIQFAIPGSGLQTITPLSPLPDITVPVTINGDTQSGATPNTNPAGQGLNTVITIQVSGASAGLLDFGMFQLAANGCTIEGLDINNTQGPDIELYGSSDDLIQGNFLGTDPTGTQTFPPNTSSGGNLDGIYLKGACADNTIGGTTPADTNLISGNDFNGIEIADYLATGNVIQGNFIGTDITGTKALPNGVGIDMYGGNGASSTVGGTATGAANVISGNTVGVDLAGPYTLQGNLIGTDPSGTLNVGNATVGVEVTDNGSGAQIIGNTIAFNGNGSGVGVEINSGSSNGNGNLVSQNSIFANGGIGIELGNEGALPIQPVPTPGPNNSQNYPTISTVSAVDGGTQITGTLTSTPGDSFVLEFFANAARDATTLSDVMTTLPGQFSEGQTYIGSYDLTLGSSGTASFTANVPSLPSSEPFVTATATDVTNTGSGPANNTSEFSPVVPLGGPSLVVTNTGDTGLGTLREAVYSADNMSGSNTITFDIPPTDPRHFYYQNDGVAGQVTTSDVAVTNAASDAAITNIDPDWPHSWYTIAPASPLPPLFDSDSINGYSQPGSSQNTLSSVTQGLNTVLTIEIDGQLLSTGDGLTIEPSQLNTTQAAGTSLIEGLVINNFSGNGITLDSFGGDTVAGNFIGTDVSGTVPRGNLQSGIFVNDVDNVTIGGSTNGAANLISDNAVDGINVYDAVISGLIEGNLIGTASNTTPSLPNGQDAILISDDTTGSDAQPGAAPAQVSPAEAGGGNIVAVHNNKDAFCAIGDENGVVVAGFTKSGKTFTGSLQAEQSAPAPAATPPPQEFHGVMGGGGPGVVVAGASITAGSAAAPEVSPFASTPPTAGLAILLEDGANDSLSYPVLDSATTATTTAVTGTFAGDPSSEYLIQFYANTALLPSGFGPGEQYIGSVDAPTASDGSGSFSFNAPIAVPVGQFITATATLLDSSGDLIETSEFSQGIPVQQGTVTVGVPNAPALSPGSDTGVSDTDGITKDNGSATAPLTFTVGGISPPNAFVQLYNDNNPASPVPLGSPVQASNGTATITLSGNPIPDGTYAIAASAALTSGGTQSALSATTTIAIQTSLRVTSISPSANFLTSLPNNQIVVSFNHWLAGLVPNKTDGTGFASNPFAVMLIPSGPDGLATQKATGDFWSAPAGVDDGDLPIPATAVYQQNANGTSTITLTPKLPLATDIYLITVSNLTDLAENSVANSAGVVGSVYTSFDYRPSPVNSTPPHVTGVSADNGTVVINNNQIPLPDTIAVAFSKPMDTYTINTSTVQLFEKGVNGPLPAAVVYSPNTQAAYLTPEVKLTPGAVYYVSVNSGATDDQGFPGPGNPAQAFVTSFTVNSSNAATNTSPLTVLKTTPLNGSEWTSALGYGAVTFSEALNANLALSLLSRFSAMLVPQTGSAVRGAGAYADVPVNAKVAFNPNTNQLIIVPTELLANDTIYLFELSNIQAANGNALAGTAYSTFLWNTSVAHIAAVVVTPKAPLASETAPNVRAEHPGAPGHATGRARTAIALHRPNQGLPPTVPAGPRVLGRK